MKKFFSLLLVLLLLFTLTVPALAEESEGDSNTETSESISDDTPSFSELAPEPEPAPAPEPEPEPGPGPEPEPEVDPEPSPDPPPEIPPENEMEGQNSVENPPADLGAPDAPAVPGDLDAPTYDVTETPTGDIIIEEHSYTRTVNILGLPVSFHLDDLTMRSALVAIFGEYTPKTQTVSTYYDGQLLDTSTEYVPGLAGADMEWIAGVVVFTVLLYCLMKLLGGVFK